MQTLNCKQRKTLAKNISTYCAQIFPGEGGKCRLAAHIGVSPQAVAQWIKGARIPTFENLYQLSRLFRVSMHELCGMKLPGNLDTKTASYEAILLLTEQQKKSHRQQSNRKKSTQIMRMATDVIKAEFAE